jgi:hypothetical protein
MKFTIFIFLCFSPYLSFCQTIQPETVQSLYLELYRDTTPVSSGTGFIIKSKTKNYLVTNYHVITNKNPVTRQWLDPKFPIAPNRIVIVQNATKLGDHIIKWERLLDDNGNPLWYQNQINNEIVDVVELPLHDTTGISIYPVPYENIVPDSFAVAPTDRVFIIGFPLGLKSAPFFPIWKSGLIASEPDINQENKPIVWIDVASFGGMSGSPTYLILNEATTRSGSRMMFVGHQTYFMGVFSHGHPNQVYGALWKASYLKNIFDKLP